MAIHVVIYLKQSLYIIMASGIGLPDIGFSDIG